MDQDVCYVRLSKVFWVDLGYEIWFQGSKIGDVTCSRGPHAFTSGDIWTAYPLWAGWSSGPGSHFDSRADAVKSLVEDHLVPGPRNLSPYWRKDLASKQTP